MLRLICSLLFLCLFTATVRAEIKGKADIGPTYIQVNVLESGKTIDRLHLIGAKGDITCVLYKGFYVKPGFILAGNDGFIASATIAAGFYLPVTESLRLLPNGGITFGYLSTQKDIEILGLYGLKERFRSQSPYVGMELCYSLNDKWTLTAIYQFAWSRTHTKIRPVVSSTGHSAGSNYAIGLEYSIDKNWAINAGFGYNESLSKEKHGIRAKGGKIGTAYYF